MALAPLASVVASIVLVITATLLLAWAARNWWRAEHNRRIGSLVAADTGPRYSRTLLAPRWQLAGRPDLLRERSDGRWVPIELKSRSTPPGGLPFSHRIQAAAYALLVEESTGGSPPFAVVRYADGGEFLVSWDASARAEVLALLSELRQPYDGRADPSTAKCRRCSFRPWCDARAL